MVEKAAPKKVQKEPVKVKSLAARMLAVMGEVGRFKKEEEVKIQGKVAYSYVDHDQVAAAIRPLLVKHGIGLLATMIPGQSPDAKALLPSIHWPKEQVILKLTMVNVDNPEDKEESFWCCPVSKVGNPQQIGAALSYAKKYALQSIFLTDSSEDADNSGTDVGAKTKRKAPPKPPVVNVESLPFTAQVPSEVWTEAAGAWVDGKPVTEEERKEMFVAAVDAGWTGEQVMGAIKHHLGASTKQLPPKIAKGLTQAFVAFAPNE